MKKQIETFFAGLLVTALVLVSVVTTTPSNFTDKAGVSQGKVLNNQTVYQTKANIASGAKELSVPNYEQYYNSICWATSASMIVSYFKGDNIDRKIQIAKDIYGEDFNYGGLDTDAGSEVEKYTGSTPKYIESVLSLDDLTKQLDAGCPMYVRIKYVGQETQHALVLKGYNGSNISINDPLDGAKHVYTYDYFLSNSGFYWKATVEFSNPKPAGPEYDASIVSADYPTNVCIDSGKVYQVSVTLKNTGTKAWNNKTQIGTSNKRDRNSAFYNKDAWLSQNRPVAVNGTVNPGETYTFKFSVKAPTNHGEYNESFELVQDGVTWFDGKGDDFSWYVIT